MVNHCEPCEGLQRQSGVVAILAWRHGGVATACRRSWFDQKIAQMQNGDITLALLIQTNVLSPSLLSPLALE